MVRCSSSSFPFSKSSGQVTSGMLPLLAQVLGSKVPKANAGNPRKEQVAISTHLRSTFPFSSPSCRAASWDTYDWTKRGRAPASVPPLPVPKPRQLVCDPSQRWMERRAQFLPVATLPLLLRSPLHWGLAAGSRGTTFGQGPQPLPWMKVVPASAGGCRSAKGTVLAWRAFLPPPPRPSLSPAMRRRRRRTRRWWLGAGGEKPWTYSRSRYSPVTSQIPRSSTFHFPPLG